VAVAAEGWRIDERCEGRYRIGRTRWIALFLLALK
jgi:hypothetical protein